MSIVDCLRWQTFSAVQDESWSMEAKSDVPRYDGDVAKLAEYQFRVRLGQAREKAMDESELKKLGPLALRLVDGLRGPALQVARGLPVDQLAKDEGTSILLKALQTTLQPRSKQEARDLYQVGAQSGGVLSRQTGESIPSCPSYVLRRKAWYNLMLDMDASLKLPEGILAEQTLQNSGLSADYQLLIRAAIQGEMTMERVCEELVAQHSRIHERETKSGKGHYSKSYKGYHGKGYGGKDRRPWSRAYHAQGPEEYYECEETPIPSRLVAMRSTTMRTLPMSWTKMTSISLPTTVCWKMVSMRLTMSEYAAEVLQAEAEAYFLRSKAGQSGHHGFGGGAARQFQVQGHLTMEERKARVQQLKSKTQCRRCGQTGHWANDPQCPQLLQERKRKRQFTYLIGIDIYLSITQVWQRLEEWQVRQVSHGLLHDQ